MSRANLAVFVFAVLTLTIIAAYAEEYPCERCEPMLNREEWEKEHRTPSNSSDKRQTAALRWNGGIIMPSVRITSIFWGKRWSDPNYVRDKITGLGLLFGGMNGSRYAAIDNEYTGSNGRIRSDTIRYQGYKVDTTSAAITAKTGSTLFYALRDTVCRNIVNPDPSGMGYYPVFVDIPRPSSVGYCAWHSYDYCRGIRIQFAFHWSLDTDTSCTVRDASGLHTPGLAALANVAAHELNEARNDPMINAWKDKDGWEGADKCSWRFPAPLVTLKNGAKFKLQPEWSNNALYARTGYNDGHGNYACVTGA